MIRLLHPIPEVQDLLGGMSRSTLYEIIKDGDIAVVKVGRRTYIADVELERYVRALTKADEYAFRRDKGASANAAVSGTKLMAGGGR